jgi:hypothetical protein
MIGLLFVGCSSTKLNTAYQRTKEASYKAVTDPLTWGSALGAGVLYATYDDDITEYFMENNLIDSEADEPLRHINGIALYSTAIFVEDDTDREMMRRLAVDVAGSFTARSTTNILNRNIQKDTPLGDDSYSAIGSHHALDPFANSALTRGNVADMSIPMWGKYTINSISYISSAGSALTRVQEGGHSFGDQLVSVSIGNFIGLFFYEVFLGFDNDLDSIQVNTNKDSFYMLANWNF